MAKNPKNPKISKPLIILNLALLLFTAIVSAHAAVQFVQRQSITQNVLSPFTIQAANFSLPGGIIGVSDVYNKTTALTITTNIANVSVKISSVNPSTLATQYQNLTLTLVYSNGTLTPYTLDLRTSVSINFTLRAPNIYIYNYMVKYTPLTTGTNTLLLDIAAW